MVFAKTAVAGAKANPLFRELAANTGKAPRWNFHKYLLNRAGQPAAVFDSAVEPNDPRVTSQIKKLLLTVDPSIPIYLTFPEFRIYEISLLSGR